MHRSVLKLRIGKARGFERFGGLTSFVGVVNFETREERSGPGLFAGRQKSCVYLVQVKRSSNEGEIVQGQFW
ncbi:MAG: hypothetical protein DRI99_05760 [Candidatus Aminicenantes bacterium]|nr:MAG: hypothetical protein DRI99_05760 [Candidatus Aminicenantes bacterium]RLE04051.1 MAG: hypothetical protein DRJ11_02290 [Candidatus Aminicenantes bacterium]